MKRFLAAFFLSLMSASCTLPPVEGVQSGARSRNYSGYERTGSTYTSVNGSWRVPFITFGSQGHVTSTSSEWVGIGGVVTAPVVQIGTVQQIRANGTIVYEAFYELFPAGVRAIGAGRVLAGDVVTASVTCASNCTPSTRGQTWTLSIQDATQNWSWSQVFSFVSDLSSAEAIEEDSTESANILSPFPNYGTVSFQDIAINGSSPKLLPSEKVYMLTPRGETSSPSDPNVTSDGFNVCWGDGRAYTSCPTITTFAFASGRSL